VSDVDGRPADAAHNSESVDDVEPVDVATVVERCRETVETGAATLTTATEKAIRVDRTRLRQLFETLVRNVVARPSRRTPNSASRSSTHTGGRSRSPRTSGVAHGSK
jgi:hypothetical protein